jgi:recombination DNA repair RAD52 pathway protein
VSFTEQQIEQLLRPINPRRVMHKQGQSHVSQQDIRAHLTRMFGFGGWDKEILELVCVRDERVTVPAKDGKPERKNVPAVTYRCTLRLTVWCPTRCCKKVSEDVGTGTAPNLPDYGDAHDFAAKNAVSYALKRCATDWGDQFGLSLYNKGQTKALVVDTLVGRPQRTDRSGAVDADVPQQESLGDREPDYAEPHQPAGAGAGAVRGGRADPDGQRPRRHVGHGQRGAAGGVPGRPARRGQREGRR